ncbi:hypothetical protein JCM24511_04949 [Saitozyma sp. JCM 24511]|nr:hypothetical protein JCM24511_04949 [Saitozyma sp. JCM 24511]
MKETSDRPTGYTHVSDTSILANRITQLELVLSRLLQRVDTVDAYHDILHDFKDPLPIFRPNVAKVRDQSVAGDSQQGAKDDFGGQVNVSETSQSLSGAFDSGGDSGMERGTGQATRTNRAVSFNQIEDTQHVAKRARAAAPASPGGAQVGPTGQVQQIGSSFANAEIVDGTFRSPTLSSNKLDAVQPLASSHLVAPQTLPIQQSSSDTVADWEVLLRGDASAGTGASAGPFDFNFLSQSTLGKRTADLTGQQYQEPASKAPSIHEHDASLALEGLALGHEYGVGRKADSGQDQQHSGAGDTAPSPGPFSAFIHQNQSPPSTSVVKTFSLANRLPSLIVGRYLMTHFLEKWRCLHRPTFERQNADLCIRLRSGVTEFTLDELSTLALYATCLCVGVHFLDEEAYRDLNIDQEGAVEMAASCWQVAQEALEASDWTQVNNVKSCQTIIVAGLYLSSIRRSNQHWTLLGIATKIAMALGLASVPDEVKVSGARHIPSRWRSAIDREVGRRVWYCLLELDWLFSLEHGFLYIISPEISQTSQPANVNDADIKEDGLVVPMPHETHTDMSYGLSRLQLLYPLQSLIRKIRGAGRMRYSFVTEAHHELQAAIASRPDFYRASEPGAAAFDAAQLHRIKRETMSLDEASNLRMMRIHRYYFPASCQNVRYHLTKETCLASARHFLTRTSATRHDPSDVRTNPHYWAQAYGVLTATVVMIIYLHHAQPREMEDIRSQAQAGIDRITDLSQRGRTDLGNTADTLRGLLSLQLARREGKGTYNPSHGDSHKRSHSESVFDAETLGNWPADWASLFDEFTTQGLDTSFSLGPVASETTPTDDQNAGLMLDNLLRDTSNIDSISSFCLKKRSGDVYSRQFMLNVLTMIKPPRRPTDNCLMVPPSASRYVTAHDEQGRAIFKYEGELQYTSVLEKSGRSARFAVPWQTSEFPTNLTSEDDATVEGGPLHNDKGTLCRVVEFPPKTSSPFHRTVSLDYGIVVAGTIHLELDDGAERLLKPGDVVVQQGTMHAWHNRSDDWGRIIFVLVAAKPVVINGKKLDNEMLR